MTTSAADPSRRRRRRKSSAAALATIAALTGGAHLLGPAPAAAMIDDGPACAGGFWIDQFGCFVRGLEGKGGGSGVDDAPARAPEADDPPCDEELGNYCVESDGPGAKKTTSKPKTTMIIGGGLGRPRSQGSEAGLRREARRSGPARRSARPAARARRSPRSCENGMAFGCETYDCKINGQTFPYPTKEKCDAAREAATTRGKTPEQQQEAERQLCAIYDDMIPLQEAQIERLDTEIHKELMKREPDQKHLLEMKQMRDEFQRGVDVFSNDWLRRGCIGFELAK